MAKVSIMSSIVIVTDERLRPGDARGAGPLTLRVASLAKVHVEHRYAS